MFTQFCQGFTYGKYSKDGSYKCDELKIEEFLENDIREKYVSIWNDFVSIRINFLNVKLRRLFERKLNVNKSKLNEFYKYFNHYRIFCVTLPVNADDVNVPKLQHDARDKRDPWMEMIEKFNGDNVTTRSRKTEMFDIGDLDDIYRFCLLWNGIYVMMHKRDVNYQYGLLTRIAKIRLRGCANFFILCYCSSYTYNCFYVMRMF